MHLQHKEATATQAVQELAAERLHIDAKQTVLTAGASTVLAFQGTLGLFVLSAAIRAGAWQWYPLGFGLCVLSFLAFMIPYFTYKKWRSDLDYEADRRALMLDAYEEKQGVTTTITASETTITADDPARLLLLLFSLWQRRNEHPTPWSVRSLEGPQYLSVDRRVFGTAQIHLGQVPTREHAQQIAARLESARLLSGNGERSTRRLQPQTLEEFLNLTIPRVLR
jgi:hypothetical protein